MWESVIREAHALAARPAREPGAPSADVATPFAHP
jgi:hypothetical protein